MALTESRCPTFSWGVVEEAEFYELLIYQLGENGEEAREVLRRSFPGSVGGWTPALDSCLERGGQYAWSVRTVGGRDASEWSSPSLFKVAAGPSETEFEAVLEVVREYLSEENTGSLRVSAGLEESAGAASATPVAGSPEGASAGPAPLSVAMGDSALQVNGSPVLTVATLEAGCLGRRWLDQGDGTVLDCNTRLIWLKDASCLGTGTHGLPSLAGTVQKKVADLNDGSTSFLCADYIQETHNDWRIPTDEELCSAALLGFGTVSSYPCPVANYATSLVDRRFGPPTVSNGDGDGLWTSGDPFVAVQSSRYWSSSGLSSRPTEAWCVDLNFATVHIADVDEYYFVWPVRGGQ